jgi:hypothetical protein
VAVESIGAILGSASRAQWLSMQALVTPRPRQLEFLDQGAPASLDALRERYLRLASRRSADGSQHWLNWALLPRDALADARGEQAAAEGTLRGDWLYLR